VTIDEVTNLSQIVASLQHLPRRPAARIAFDPGMGPADYRQAVDAISKAAYIMAEPVDSSEVAGYTRPVHSAVPRLHGRVRSQGQHLGGR
jgi:hypothetical protein